MSDKKNCNPLESVETHRKYHVDNPLTNMTNRGYTKTILKTDQNNPVVKEYVDAMKRGMNPNPTEKQIREAIKKSNDEQYETFHGHKRPTPPVESWEKEFDEKFTHTLQDDDEKIINWTTDSADIKQFISSQIQQAEERLVERIKLCARVQDCSMCKEYLASLKEKHDK